jgi:hypothetical protein
MGASPQTGKDSVNVLNIAGRQCRHGGPIIEMVVQAIKSPDLNANDHAYFASMAARVNKCHVRDVDGIVKGVAEQARTHPPETLTSIFELKSRVLKCIIDANGNNDFKIPHRRKT